MHFDLGTVPDWVAAIGTVGTLVAAVYIYSRNLMQSREAVLKSQARLFDAWILTAGWRDYLDPVNATMTQRLYVTIELSNASGQSMRCVDADIAFANEWDPTVYALHVVPPTSPGNLAKRDVPMGVTPTPELTSLSSDILRGFLKLNIRFTDASGNRWKRTWSGDIQYLHNVARHSDTAQLA